MGKIILNLAISLDGYICDPDGGFEWIKGDGDTSNDTQKKFDFVKFLDSVELIVMGRVGYEDCPPEGMEMYTEKKIYVATSKKLDTPANVEIVHENVVEKVSSLRDQGDIWLYGGAGLTDAFIKADVIDEYIIGVVPIILGNGRPLFLENNPLIELHLDECTAQEGIVIMRYTKRDILE